MRANSLILVALLATPALVWAEQPAEEAKPEDSKQDATELLEVSETANNNTASAASDPDAKNNSKRTIEHNLGYGYRYNTVLRPVHPGMHFMAPSGSSLAGLGSRGLVRPMFKMQRFPLGYGSSLTSPLSSPLLSGGSQLSGSSLLGSSLPFRFSQQLPSPAEQSNKPREEPRPVTETPPSAPQGETYRTLPHHLQGDSPPHHHSSHPQHSAYPSTASYEEQDAAAAASPAKSAYESATKVLYADAPPAASKPASSSYEVPAVVHQQYEPEQSDASGQSYQQLLHHHHQLAEPTYILAPAAAAPSHAMYAQASHHPHHHHAVAATQMIPVIIVRLMDPHAVAASSGSPAYAHPAAYPLVNMQLVRDYLSKLYDPDPVMYVATTSPAERPSATVAHHHQHYFGPSQLHKLHLQQQLHAQLQKQLQTQQQQQQQQQHLQQQRQQQTVAAILQEQHRQRVAAAQHAEHARTEVTVHRSPAMSPQDYKDSVEQQDDS